MGPNAVSVCSMLLCCVVVLRLFLTFQKLTLDRKKKSQLPIIIRDLTHSS